MTFTSAAPRTGSTADCIDHLEQMAAALDALAEVAPGELSGAELSEAVVATQRLRDRLEGLQARFVSVWDANNVWADDGARSGAAWISHTCRLPRQMGRAVVSFARRLRSAPRTEAGLVEGSVGAAQARRLCRALGHGDEAFSRDEEMLVDHARSLRYADFDRAVTYWEQMADPDGTERDAAQADERRRLHISKTFENTWAIDALGDTIGGAVVAQVLQRLDDELFEADWARAKAGKGDDVTVDDLSRTPAQRRFDALVLMAVRALTAPCNGTPPRPLFTVLVDYETLAGRVCELSDGTVVTPGQLAPWVTSADIQRVVFESPSRVLDVGRRRRLFTGATRRALEVRDRYCTGFACDEPPERCEGDHVEPYSVGGPTVQDNGRLRCPAHHPGRRMQPRAGPGP